VTDAIPSRAAMCQARVQGDWRSRPCPHKAKHEFAGYWLCGTHLRQARKWNEQGRFRRMAEWWWKTS
jgi:hypothetical protein